MKTVAELLRDADPLRYEPEASSEQRDSRRRAVLAAASSSLAPPRARSRIAMLIVVPLMVVVAAFVGVRVWPLLVGNVQAAVRFEVRLAEDKPAPGLDAAKVGGTDRSVYLHKEMVVTNSDISKAELIQGNGPSQYSVSVEFNESGTQKMRAATAGNIGKLMAILLDGQVVMAPVIRSPIDSSAVITGHFTRAQAQRIATGITAQ